MILEISLRPPVTLPQVLQSRKKEQTQRAHWVGQDHGAKQGKIKQENPKDDFQGGGNQTRDDLLSTISFSDVDDALKMFNHQFKPIGENWIAVNHFCTVPLMNKGDDRPPAIFGRVKTAFPSDGYLQNIEQLVLLFPRLNQTPLELTIRNNDINYDSTVQAQSYQIRVAFKALQEDMGEFDGTDQLFAEYGFTPEFDPEYYDLLEMNDQNQTRHPWLYVIDSRWSLSMPESRYYEIMGKFREMLDWGKTIMNYHPRWRSQGIVSLNEVFDLKYRLTKYYLTEPETPKQTADIAAILFDERFNQGIPGKRSANDTANK